MSEQSRLCVKFNSGVKVAQFSVQVMQNEKKTLVISVDLQRKGLYKLTIVIFVNESKYYLIINTIHSYI